ncbi:selenium cofactor biosynthesis protein YqeC [Agarivorans gilvus]|nr:selenium cofactor biosynthesis protein YqeC [Agarivorans gilvus]
MLPVNVNGLIAQIMLQLNQYHTTAADFEAIQMLAPAARFISVVGAGGKSHLIKWLAAVYQAQGFKVCVTTTTKTYLPEGNEFNAQICLAEPSPAQALVRQMARVNVAPGGVYFLYKQRLAMPANQPPKVQGFSVTELSQLAELGLFDVYLVEADGAKHLPLKAPAGHEPCICEQSDLLIGVTGAEAIFSPAAPQQIHRWPLFSKISGCVEGAEVDEAALSKLLVDPQGLFKNSPKQANKLWLVNKMDRCSDPLRLRLFAQQVLSQTALLNAVWLSQLDLPSPTVERYFAS